jgi:hypothetical protein
LHRTIGNPWLLAAVGIVALVMAPVLFGFAPLGGDPELMYQPIKAELARALAEWRLPFWSDRFGLGVPLVAESHVAAFYPPNWLFYRLWDVGTAYRLALWLHSVAIAAATFAYARTLGIGSAGSAMAAVGFALCGFQAVHDVHEPFYHLMPFLPLCLLLADRYAATGRAAWLAGLAIAWGAQVTLGHFQIQMWTAGLVLLAGAWRVLGWPSGGTSPAAHPSRERERAVHPTTGAHPAPSRSRLSGSHSPAETTPARGGWRIVGLIVGIAWGAAIAWAQLRLTGELTGVAGFVRPAQFLSNYLLPPGHWAQFALPAVFLGKPRDVADYWGHHGTTAGEACAYVGVVPLILAFVGLVAAPRDRALWPWRLVTPLALALATMPGWWPDGFYFLLQIPGLGTFRAPARYTLLTSLGLVLFAGRGLDLGRSISPRRFWGALALAVAFGGVAWWWSLRLAQDPEFRAALGEDTLVARFAGTGLAWALGLAATVAWRLGRVGAWAPVALAAVELAVLFFVGPSWWAWDARLPGSSPVLRRLVEAGETGLVAGRLLNVPVDAGLTTAFPNLGIVPPPPNYLLEPAMRPPGTNNAVERRWQRRFGVTHGIWAADDDVVGMEVLAVMPDPGLDRVMASVPRLHGRGPWKLVRDPGAFPAARVALRVREADGWGPLYTTLSHGDLADEAWFLAEDGAPRLTGPPAGTARVRSWDRRAAVVEHDGSCVLILRRTYYPGWSYRIDGGPEHPVLKVDGGLHGIPLAGSGIHRVEVRYRPTGLRQAVRISMAALGAAVLVLLVDGWRAIKGRRSR